MRALALSEVLSIGATNRVLYLVLADLALQGAVLRAVLPGNGKVVWSPWRIAAQARKTLCWKSHGREKVWRRLTRWTFEAKVDKVLFRSGSRPKVDLTSLV